MMTINKNIRWPFIIIALLLTHMTLMMTAVVVCSRGNKDVVLKHGAAHNTTMRQP